MPRTSLTKTTLTTNGWPTAGVTATVTAADASNLNSCTFTGKEVIIARNSGVGARTVTITSVTYLGRTGHITAQSIAAGATAVFGPFAIDGWRQTDGALYFEGSHAEILFTVLVLP